MNQQQAIKEIKEQLECYIGDHIVLPCKLVAAAIGWPNWLPADERPDGYIASTQDWLPPVTSPIDDPSDHFGNPQPSEALLKARRARLLERIHEAREWLVRFPSDTRAHEAHIDLKDELAAVESALGAPEPKEPREASDEAYDLQLKYCKHCLCLLNHEDPMQSCQCGG